LQVILNTIYKRYSFLPPEDGSKAVMRVELPGENFIK